jgi:tripartite-type tricarboxylate transporter receptor subunit TctC
MSYSGAGRATAPLSRPLPLRERATLRIRREDRVRGRLATPHPTVSVESPVLPSPARGEGKLASAVLLLFLLLASVLPARAEDAASFYRGKQIRFIVGSAPGGTYDLLARIVARHMGAHIPGAPTIIVQNQPTAGGLAMVNQLYAIGPKDGTVIGVPLNGIPAAPLLEPAVAHFDAAKLIWVGSTHSEPYVAYVWHTAPAQSLAEVASKQLVVGATTPGTTMSDFPHLTNAVLHSKFKIVPGYGSTPQMNEALERGEIEGIMGFGWFALNAQVPQWVAQKKINVIAQFGLARSRTLPDVPLMIDLAKSEADRRALAMLFGRTEYGRPYFLPPDVPADRVGALRRAFDATMKDDGFAAEAAKIGFAVDPLTGEQVQTAVGELARTPADVVARVRAALNEP